MRGSIAALAGSSVGGSRSTRERLRCGAVGQRRGGATRGSTVCWLVGARAARCGWRSWRWLHLPPPCSSIAVAGILASRARGDAHGWGWWRWSAGGSLGDRVASVVPSCPLVFGGGEVNGVDDESTIAMGGSGKVVVGMPWSVVRRVELGRSGRACEWWRWRNMW
jgi:hypothetical protein